MATIVTRAGKGSPLTNTEMDANLTNLNAQTPVGGGVAATAGINNDITGLSGLLSVPSIIQSAINSLYPIGSIYTSTVSTSPATLFGFGTWAAFGTGKVLIGAGTGWVAGATGGSADAAVVIHTHTFTGDALPTHLHTTQYQYNGSGGSAGVGTAGGIGSSNTSSVSGGTPTGTNAVPVGSVAATNQNLQPYIVVYMWNRTA